MYTDLYRYIYLQIIEAVFFMHMHVDIYYLPLSWCRIHAWEGPRRILNNLPERQTSMGCDQTKIDRVVSKVNTVLTLCIVDKKKENGSAEKMKKEDASKKIFRVQNIECKSSLLVHLSFSTLNWIMFLQDREKERENRKKNGASGFRFRRRVAQFQILINGNDLLQCYLCSSEVMRLE